MLRFEVALPVPDLYGKDARAALRVKDRRPYPITSRREPSPGSSAPSALLSSKQVLTGLLRQWSAVDSVAAESRESGAVQPSVVLGTTLQQKKFFNVF